MICTPKRPASPQSLSARALQRRVVAAGRPPTSAFGAVSDVADAAVRMPLATLLTGNVVNPGEIIQLVIKPSRWFILLNSIRFAAVVIILVLGLRLLGVQRVTPTLLSFQFTIFLIAGRLMWSVVQWMGRYYLLTDLRLIRVSGVFDVDIQACPLRAVQSIRLYRPAAERLMNRGSIEIAGPDGVMAWQTIARCKYIHETLLAAVAKSKQNGCGQ